MQVQQVKVQSASWTNSSTQAARSITEQELMAVRRSTHTYHQRICIVNTHIHAPFCTYPHVHRACLGEMRCSCKFLVTFAPLMRGREIERSVDARFVAEQRQEVRHAVFC
jgi:hypothetical protein